jgi:pimeloyl-ACP methyl ester carboxylesterase
LATLGQPSLRFDVRDVGDSEGALQPHLDLDAMYSEGTVEDALRAYDWVQTQKPGKIQVIGLCLGAFLGMQLTARRPVSRAVLFNGLAFVWNEEARASSMTAHIRGSLLDGRRWRRLLTGKIDARALAEAILQKTRLNAKRGLLKLQGKPPPNPVAELIATVQARGTNLQLISSEGDPSITYLESNVPQEQRPTLTIFGGVDHTLRPVWSHARVVAFITSESPGAFRAN